MIYYFNRCYTSYMREGTPGRHYSLRHADTSLPYLLGGPSLRYTAQLPFNSWF